MAGNPLINAAAGGFEDLFATSPVKAVGGYLASPADAFPCLTGLVRTICGGANPEDDVDNKNSSSICAHRILNGCLWSWVGEVGDLVRSELLSRDHFLDALHFTPVAEEHKTLNVSRQLYFN